MTDADALVAQLASCVELFREAGAKDQQKAAFRVLLDLLQTGGLHLREDDRGVQVNGAAVSAVALGALSHRLALHNVSEIRVPTDAPPAEVFALLQALSEPPAPSGDDIPNRLRTAGITHVRVAVGPPPPEPRSGPGGPAQTLGTEGLLRGEPMQDIRSVARDAGSSPLVTYEPEVPTPEEALPSVGSASVMEVVLSGERAASPPPGERAGPAASAPISSEGAPPGPPPPRPSAAAPSLNDAPRPSAPGPRADGAAIPSGVRAAAGGDLLAQLERQPAGPQIGDTLAQLGQRVEEGVRAQRWEDVLLILAALVELEQRVPEDARRLYGIAVRRMYSKPVLHGVAGFLGMPGHETAVAAVLRRAGADGAEILLDRLMAAQTIGERRAVFDALRHMREGRDQLVHLLGHPKWFVVRNVAELIGELGMDEGVSGLAQLLAHADERVRKAAALALAKIGTTAASEPLRRALRDPSPEVRRQVAIGVGGQRAQGLAMPLVVALDEEKDEGVQRELILALGRIGTPAAVQALLKLAQPAGRVFGRKPAGLRLAAVDGLRLAATPVATATLEGLAGDADRQVSAAAQGALADLKSRKK